MSVMGCSTVPEVDEGECSTQDADAAAASGPVNTNTEEHHNDHQSLTDQDDQNASNCIPGGDDHQSLTDQDDQNASTPGGHQPLIPEVVPAVNREVGPVRTGLGSWPVFSTLLAIPGWLTPQSRRQPLLTHMHAEAGSAYIEGPIPCTICNMDDWANVDTDALPSEEQHLKMYIEELLARIRRQEEEMNQKHEEAMIAQSKVNQLLHEKEQQAEELIHWTEIAKNCSKDLHRIDDQSRPVDMTDPNNLEEIAALSQKLREWKEELRVKEDKISSKAEDYCKLQNVVNELRQQNEVLRQQNEEFAVKFNSNYSYKSTSQYYEQEWKKLEADLARRHKVEIEKILLENEELRKRIRNWSQTAQHYENEYKKILKTSKDHNISQQKSRGFSDAQLQTYQQGASTSIIMKQQHHHHHQQQHYTCGSQIEYQKALMQTRQQEEEIAVLRAKLQHNEERSKELQSRMQTAEQMVAQHKLVDTALYQDDEATPTLLQSTADTVKSSISMCASSISKFATEHSLSINASQFTTLDEQHCLDMSGHNKKQVVKMALQAILCEVLFHSFESPTYSNSSASWNVPFEKPQVLRKRRLELFQKLRLLEAAEIRKQNQQFDSFVQVKGMLVLKKLCELLCQNTHETPVDETKAVIANLVQSDLHQRSSFHNSFLRLAKAVWLLHEVAFACQPASAEIFRVSANSLFMKGYMIEHEDMTQSNTLMAHAGEDKGKRRLVALMNVPGFTLRNSVIKSVVCCFDSLSPAAC